MLEIIKDSNSVLAICEWNTFNSYGTIDEYGEILIVSHIEVFQGNGKHYIMTIINNILNKSPQAKSCYFIRDYKYPNRQVRKYSREQFERLVHGWNNR